MKMKGEDKIFLLQVINAVNAGGEEMHKFRTSKESIDRLIRIVDEVGKEQFNEELIRLKEVVYGLH